MRMGIDETLEDWVTAQGQGQLAGADPKLVGAGDWLDWKDKMEEGGVELVEIENIIDNVWTVDNGRPPNIFKNIVIHGLEFSGQQWTEKMEKLRTTLMDSKYDGMVVSELDEVSWLLNLRGEGESHNEGRHNN